MPVGGNGGAIYTDSSGEELEGFFSNDVSLSISRVSPCLPIVPRGSFRRRVCVSSSRVGTASVLNCSLSLIIIILLNPASCFLHLTFDCFRRRTLATGTHLIFEGTTFKSNTAVYHSGCLLYTSPSPRDATLSRMPSSA